MAENQAFEDQIQRTGQDQIDYLAGNQYYLNPETGRTFTLPTGEGKIYHHDDGGDSGSNIRTSDAYQQLQMPSDWVQLKAIPH